MEMADRKAFLALVDLFLVDSTCVADVVLCHLACEVDLLLDLAYEDEHPVGLPLQERTSYFAFADYTFHLELQQEALEAKMASDS